jgi:spermidine synthase
VGIDVYAVTIGVSAFFAGLGLGGYLFGRRGDRCARPLILYAELEMGVALSGVAATFGLAHSARVFNALELRFGILAWGIPILLVGLPAVVMGGVLPVIVRLASSHRQIGAAGGFLYATNTAGAILGVLLAPFLLLPWLGVQRSALAAATVNLTAALGALACNRFLRIRMKAVPWFESEARSSDARLALILYAISGGIALGYEVVWSQTIVQFASTRSFAFSIVLATYLSGLVAGSALYARRAGRTREPWGAFGILIATAGLAAILAFAGLGNRFSILQSDVEESVRNITGNDLAAMCGRFATAAIGVIFLPAALLGAAFPAVLELAASARHASRDVGMLIALNTAGGIVGTFVTGFVLIPAVGLVGALGILAMAAAAVGLWAASGHRVARSGVRWAIFAASAVTVIAAALSPHDRFARILTQTRSGGKVIFYQESPGGTVAVIEQGAGHHTVRRLYVQGVSNSGDAMTSLRYMRLQSLLPLLIHPGEPRAVLVIGLGAGVTAGSLLNYPGLERRVCAELLPAVARAASLFRGNFGAASDRRIDLRLRDGRRELLQNSERYDLIALEPPPPSAAGVVNLYSSDFYRLAAARLQPGGMLAQWWPLSTQNDEDSRSIVRSFIDSFPYASLWTTELHEMLLVGALQPMELDVPRIARRFNYPAIRAALSEVGISSPAALLSTWVTGREGLDSYVADAPPVTDDRPGIEYAAWVRRGEFVKVLPQILALGSEPPLVGADSLFRDELMQQRDALLGFYAAALYAYRGQPEPWARELEIVLRKDPNNAYYRWIMGREPATSDH